MHQDGLLARVDVELDDVALAVAVQKLITCKKGRDEADFKNAVTEYANTEKLRGIFTILMFL